MKIKTSLHPHMTDGEQEMLIRYLSNSHYYLEFGSGGSTILASLLVQAHVYSVDSSVEWQEKVKEECLKIKTPLFPRLIPVDIGQLGEWGFPLNHDRKFSWLNYYSLLWELCDAKKTDLCLIDGRFRVASFMSALLNCRDDSVLLIHDFDSRPQYHIIRDVADEIESVHSLYAFKRAKGVKDEQIKAIMEEYKYTQL